MEPELLPLGAWESDRASIQAAGIPDRGDVSDLPSTVQFQVHVARIIRRRESNCHAEFDGAAAFVLVTPAQYQTFKIDRKEERLIHTGGRRLIGRIHFVTSVATSSVVEEFSGDDSTLFERLQALGVAQLPTLIYLPQDPESSLSFYPSGTSTDDGLTEVPLVVPKVTALAIEKTINTVHAHELVTPDNMGPMKIWSEPTKRRPSENAERSVQQLIRIGLAVGFAPCSIRQEQSGKVGRTDLEIIDDRTGQPGHVSHLALIELKVLRSRGETGTEVSYSQTKKHIEEGVNQAHLYGKDKNSKLRMLCCFDMRDADIGDSDTFSHVNASAQTLNVLLHRWFMYHDSKAYRAAEASLAVGSN